VPVYARSQLGDGPRLNGLLVFANALTVVLAQIPVTKLAEGRRRMVAMATASVTFVSPRGLKTTATGQRFLEGFEAVQALRGGNVALRYLVPGYRPQWPLAATMRAPWPLPWSPWQQG